MAVFWLVFDGAEGQMRMISVLATPARGRWVNQCLCASLAPRKVWSERLPQTGAFTKDGRSPPQTNKEASHASLRSARRLRDEKPGDLCSPAQAAALCTACAHNWAASAPHRSNKYAPRRPAVAPIARQQSSAPKAPEPGAA